jgi:hypothetical protein
MLLKTVLIINTIIAGFFAILILITPATVSSWFGISPNNVVEFMFRIFAVIALEIGLVTFFLINTEYNATVKSVLAGLLISTICGLTISIWTIYSIGVSLINWIAVLLILFVFISCSTVILRMKVIKQK